MSIMFAESVVEQATLAGFHVVAYHGHSPHTSFDHFSVAALQSRFSLSA